MRTRNIVPPTVRRPLWKKATWAVGITAACAITGLTYARNFWGRGEVTQQTEDLEAFYSHYDQGQWAQLEKAGQSTPNQPVTLFDTPHAIPWERIGLNDVIHRDPRTLQNLNGEELPPPDVFRITIPPDRSIAEVREHAYAATLPKLHVTSTNEIDFHRERGRVRLSDFEGIVNTFYLHEIAYLAIYNILPPSPETILEDLQGQQVFSLPVSGFFNLGEYRLPEPTEERLLPLWSMSFRQGQHEATMHFYLPGPYKNIMNSITGYWEVPQYIFVHHYADAIDRASDIVSKAHPQLHPQNVRILLRRRLMIEMGSMEAEDIWQDRAACRLAHCEWQERFDSMSNDHEAKVGVPDPFFGRILDLPDTAWRFLSWTYKYRLDRQGLGPAQNIIGLVKRAGRDQGLVGRYTPYVTLADFRDERAIVRAVLDPVKAIYIRAMTLDMILGELERTFFADPRVTYPANQVPFITNPDTAREYAFIYIADQLWNWPELDRYLPALLTGDASVVEQIHTGLFSVADIFGLPLEFPGMFIPRIQVGGRTSLYLDYEVRGSSSDELYDANR